MAGDLVSAILAFGQANSKFPGHAPPIYALGSVYACRGEIEKVDTMFAKDVGVMTGNGTLTYTRALRFGGKNHLQLPTLTRVMHFNAEGSYPPGGWRAVYLSAADSVYLCRYARALARSIACHSYGGILLHLHVINPTSEAWDILNSMVSGFPSFTVSTEQVDLSNLSECQRMTYYACSRYLILPEVLSACGCPIVIADMDQMLMADPTPLFLLSEGKDVSLL
jgi:hypothetical protein